MQQVTVNLYEYHELHESVKKIVRERVQEKGRARRYDDIMDDQREFAREYLSDLGYPTDDIRYRLGWCQGDGMAFYGTVSGENLRKLAKRLLTPAQRSSLFNTRYPIYGDPLVDYVAIQITPADTHYDHWNSMNVDIDYQIYSYQVDLDAKPKFMAAVEALRDAIDEDVKTVSRYLERAAYDELEAEWQWTDADWDEEVERYYDGERFYSDGSVVKTSQLAA